MILGRTKYSVVSILFFSISLVLLSLYISGKMGFAAAVTFPWMQIEDKLQLTRAIEQERDVEQTRGSITVQPITGAAGGGGRCEQCQFIVYESKSSAPSKAVIAYTSPAPIDLSGAKRIVFFAKGELGGETINALAIGKLPDSGSSQEPRERVATQGTEPTEPIEEKEGTAPKSPTIPFEELKFGVVSPNIVLTNEWKRYELSVERLDLKDVTSPFGVAISNQRGSTPIINPPIEKTPLNNRDVKDISSYLKGISVDDKAADNPINGRPQLTTTQRAANETFNVPFPFIPFKP
jgi:hypothetical protein